MIEYHEGDDDDDDEAVEVEEIEAPAPAIQWGKEQAQALDMIEAWRRGGVRQLFRLFGYAGTGKTFVTKEIARRSGGRVLYCAFTGKAALVMQGMGCHDAKTIHSAIYKPRSELVEEAKALRTWLETSSGESLMMQNLHLSGEELYAKMTEHQAKCREEAMRRWNTTDRDELEYKLYKLRDRIEAGPEWVLRDEIDEKPRLIIVDECSMVAEALARDLMSFGVPIIVIGDPFQLPPVKGAGYFTEAEPNAMLTEIHRQALGSPVTRMATTVRTDGAWALKMSEYGDSRYVKAGGDQLTDLLLGADQVLAGTHKNRRLYNAAIREAMGYYGDMPLPDEKIICRHNNKLHKLLNGSMWRVMTCEKKGRSSFQAHIQPWDEPNGVIREVVMHAEPFAGREVLVENLRDAELFDWGYCITIHSAQGSQWPHVAMINDAWPGPDRFMDRMIYTGITRAQQKVTVIKPQPVRMMSRMKPRLGGGAGAGFWTSPSRRLSER